MASTSLSMADAPLASEPPSQPAPASFDLHQHLPAQPRRLLVIQTAFIGDVILALPVLQSLRTWYPAAELVFLVRRGNEGLLANHPAVDRILTWDKDRNKQRNLLRLAGELHRTAFDGVINLHRYFSTGLLVLASWAPVRAGFSAHPMAPLIYTHARPHRLSAPGETPIWHEVDRNRSLLGDGPPPATRRPRLFPSDADEARVDALPEPSPRIVLAPASVWPAKQWPPNRWQELIAACRKMGPLALAGGPEDRALCAELAENQAGVHNYAGELHLLQTAALMARAAVVVTNDSAPQHLASAVNAPTVSLFTATHPRFGFGPLAERSRVVEPPPAADERPPQLHAFKRLSPALARSRAAISAEQVQTAIQELLEK